MNVPVGPIRPLVTQSETKDRTKGVFLAVFARKCGKGNGFRRVVAASLPPARLAEALDLLPSWGRGSHVKISDLPGLFSRDLRFPRLAHSHVIARSIADGPMDPTWGAFGYAAYHDDANGYAGLYFRGNGRAPGAGLLGNGVGYLVTPSACMRSARGVSGDDLVRPPAVDLPH